jgi:hypothetical protein
MRVFFTCALFAGFFTVSAQLNWKVTNDGIYQCEVSSCLGETDEGIGLITLVPVQLAFQEAKYKIQFRYYDEDMLYKTSYDLPENVPSRLDINRFDDYIAISGMNDKSPQGNGSAEVIFLNSSRQEVLRKDWKLAASSHEWHNKSTTYISSDSACFIVDFIEDCYPDKPSLASFPQVHHIAVFNNKPEQVWDGSADFESLLNKQSFEIKGMDYTADGKLLVYGTQTIERKRHVVAWVLSESAGNPTKVVDELMPEAGMSNESYQFMMQAHISPANELFLFCTGIVYVATKNILYVRQSLSDATDKNVAYYLVDKQFAETHPEFKASYDEFPLLHKFCFTDQGLFVGGEYIKQEKSANVLKTLYLFNFGKDGRVSQTTQIQRELYLGTIGGVFSMNLFSSGNDLIVFYSDKPDNVVSNVLIPGKRQYTVAKALNETCLAVAKITPDGQILYRKVMNAYNANSVMADNSMIFNVGHDRYIIRGETQGKHAFSSFTLE